MEVIICNPTGNITALVPTPTEERLQPEIANQIMEQEPTVEQVGFVSFGENGVSLRMAGGEFCGNATMSAAALYGADTEVNGLPVTVSPVGNQTFACRVRMPEPVAVSDVVIEGVRLPFVSFGTIAHLICEDRTAVPDPEAVLPRWCETLDVPALGIMFPEGEVLTPLVYVRDVDSLFWESSCASGTAAVGYYTKQTREYREPGGILGIRFDENGALFLSGSVVIERTIRL